MLRRNFLAALLLPLLPVSIRKRNRDAFADVDRGPWRYYDHKAPTNINELIAGMVDRASWKYYDISKPLRKPRRSRRDQSRYMFRKEVI